MAVMSWRPVFHCGAPFVYNKGGTTKGQAPCQIKVSDKGVRHLAKLRREDGDLTRALTPLSWK